MTKRERAETPREEDRVREARQKGQAKKTGGDKDRKTG